jgi:hypothetical protein
MGAARGSHGLAPKVADTKDTEEAGPVEQRSVRGRKTGLVGRHEKQSKSLADSAYIGSCWACTLMQLTETARVRLSMRTAPSTSTTVPKRMFWREAAAATGGDSSQRHRPVLSSSSHEAEPSGWPVCCTREPSSRTRLTHERWGPGGAETERSDSDSARRGSSRSHNVWWTSASEISMAANSGASRGRPSPVPSEREAKNRSCLE